MAACPSAAALKPVEIKDDAGRWRQGRFLGGGGVVGQLSGSPPSS